MLVYGPALVRDVTLRDSTVQLTGDTVAATGLEVWGPRGITDVTWNGSPVRSRVSGTGSLLALRPLPGVGRVVLPALDGGWRRRTENPESAPDFDDSAWTVADRKTSHSVTPVPDGRPVLFADDYGFHYGDVWYRGHFTAAADAVESVSLAYSTGTQGLLMAWLDGEPLGTHRMPVPDNSTARKGSRAATATFAVPEKVRDKLAARLAESDDERILSVLVRRMQHDQDGKALDSHKVARGLTEVTFKGASPKVSWRVQGDAPNPCAGCRTTAGSVPRRTGGLAPAGVRRRGLGEGRRLAAARRAPPGDAEAGVCDTRHASGLEEAEAARDE
ncbi:hypothetical protein SALBM311S_01718 [Streptomyces alboniger]